MAGLSSAPPVTPILLQGTSAINFKAGVAGSAGAAKDTQVFAFHILSNASAVNVTLTGFVDSTGAAANIVWTGSTTQDVIITFPAPILNTMGAFSATASVGGKVWLYIAPYNGGPV